MGVVDLGTGPRGLTSAEAATRLAVEGPQRAARQSTADRGHPCRTRHARRIPLHSATRAPARAVTPSLADVLAAALAAPAVLAADTVHKRITRSGQQPARTYTTTLPT